jgi:predicted nucleic acid-binding protein
MNAVMIDTSVWVDFFNAKSVTPETQALKDIIGSDCQVCLCPVIYQEILQGIREDSVFENIKAILLDFEMITLPVMEVTNRAVDLYRSLRKQGITIRKANDCLIAAYAIALNIPLLHRDSDFNEISKKSSLLIYGV